MAKDLWGGKQFITQRAKVLVWLLINWYLYGNSFHIWRQRIKKKFNPSDAIVLHFLQAQERRIVGTISVIQIEIKRLKTIFVLLQFLQAIKSRSVRFLNISRLTNKQRNTWITQKTLKYRMWKRFLQLIWTERHKFNMQQEKLRRFVRGDRRSVVLKRAALVWWWRNFEDIKIIDSTFKI